MCVRYIIKYLFSIINVIGLASGASTERQTKTLNGTIPNNSMFGLFSELLLCPKLKPMDVSMVSSTIHGPNKYRFYRISFIKPCIY